MTLRIDSLVAVLLGALMLAAPSCGSDTCGNFSCSMFGGSASKTVYSCLTDLDCSSSDGCTKKYDYEVRDGNTEVIKCEDKDNASSCRLAFEQARQAVCASTTGSTSSSTSASTGTGSGCTTPNDFVCGTDAAGVETPCAGTQVCCYTLGPNASQTCGAASRCVNPGPTNGASDRCSAGQFELCKTDSECGAGYHCNAPTQGYCVPA